MERKTMLEALHIAAVVGISIGFVLDVLLLSQLNVISLAVITFSGYMVFKNNELFWEIVEKVKRR
jgi:hypothetical protein